ncbi:hypothetical protein J6590_106964, partial [Homalodisca vitripennis]
PEQFKSPQTEDKATTGDSLRARYKESVAQVALSQDQYSCRTGMAQRLRLVASGQQKPSVHEHDTRLCIVCTPTIDKMAAVYVISGRCSVHARFPGPRFVGTEQEPGKNVWDGQNMLRVKTSRSLLTT